MLELTLSVVDSPTQISLSEAETVTTGSGSTVMVTEAAPVQPSGLVPVTEYVVVAAGLTLMAAVLAPVLQMKVVPGMLLEAVIVAEALRQISRSEAAMLTTGSGFTVMVIEPVAVQP